MIDDVRPREGEDALAWIMRTRNMSFPEAVQYVAQELRRLAASLAAPPPPD